LPPVALDSIAAVETAEIKIGDSVAVFGQGSMGLECLQIARASGAGLLLAVDVRDERLPDFEGARADHVIDARRSDPVEVIRDLTVGNGADVVFECAGGSPRQGLAGSQTLTQAVDAVRSGGKIIGVSWFGQPLEVDVDLLRGAQLALPVPRYQHQGAPRAQRFASQRRAACSENLPSRTLLDGIEKVREAFEITAAKGKYGRSIRRR
jgi:threonine dehydrogenase-like Zn-dependent dehydrogenase